MDFREADRRYADLKQQYDNGDINAGEFRARHEQITVRDASGTLWAKHRDTGEWHYYDGTTWVRGTPPGDEEAVTEPTTGGPPTQIPPPRDPGAIEDGEKRRRTLPWVLAVGVVSLIAIAVYLLLVGNANDAETAALPNVVGKARDDAQKILSTEGFEARVQTRESSQEDEGTVLEQSPPAGSEAERGSEVAILVGEAPPPEEALPPEAASGPAPGYTLVEDPSGSLTMEIPDGWRTTTGQASEEGPQSWSSFTGESIQSSITAAPDLDAWVNGGSSGTYAVASRTLAQEHTDDELLSYGPMVEFSTNCTPGPLQDFERGPYSGRMQTWTNCGAYGQTRIALSAAPPDRECVVVLQIVIVDEDDVEVGQHILDTFEADCGSVA